MLRLRKRMLSAMMACCGFSALFQGCPVVGSVVGTIGDCFASGSISEDEFDDLNFLAQLGYEENDCGRYVPRDGFFD